MNAVKIIFLECTNLLCRFHIDKNVKAKCRSLIGQKNAWDYVMDAWGSLIDSPFKHQFDDCLKKFEIAYSPWPMFVDYVHQTWMIPHKERFVKVWTNKVIVSRYLRLTFVFNIHMNLASFPQFMVLVVGIIHIFMFSLILLSRYSQFCELMWINFSFRLKEEGGLSSWCLTKRAICAYWVTSVKRGTQLA